MPTTDTSERALEDLVVNSLINDEGYDPGRPEDFDKTYCVDRAQLAAFLTATQPAVATQLGVGTGSITEDKFLKRLADQIALRGVVDVLRKGVKHNEHAVTLYYPRPASTLNPAAVVAHESNRFTVTRQLRYSADHPGKSLDLGLFVNGLPVATLELKNRLTGQTAHDAVRQYRQDRDPKEPLFVFKRCLVHFAVDEELVFMTTRLAGPQTTFLPFNQGHDDGAGNPPNPYGLRTDYLWRGVLTRHGLAEIVEKFARLVTDKNGCEQLIFPRYHQRRAVRDLLRTAKADGPGKRYLIQHSAGSGKSNTIAWLAHQVIEIMRDDGHPVFNSAVIVTDRIILDGQIEKNVRQFELVRGVAKHADSSGQLRVALEENKRIIITTVQKFPYIAEEVAAQSHRTFAVIIDEAHSSQTGDAAGQMNAALGGAGADEPEDAEDRINAVIDARKMLKNVSYFAFTATPKAKTLELFGRPVGDGFRAFDVYPMKQAIEEGFILDVLANYTTFQSYYKLVSTDSEHDPEYDRARAQKRLKAFVEGHPEAVRRKAEIMVDHFAEEVAKKIDGRARAMVVANGIERAIRYKQAFDAYLAEIKSPHRAIVAFSGKKTVDGLEYDEAAMNKFPSSAIPETFAKDPYRFLIVADKFQTGFDEPLLHTMYVDKPLADVKAVQTLSRLNRARAGKADTFVLDFVNDAEHIRQAFEPFYRGTLLSEGTDLNRLNDLQDLLDAAQVYAPDQVRELADRYFAEAPRDKLDPILDVCVEAFRKLEPQEQGDFKARAKSFVRTYQFLTLILPVKNVYWESLRVFLSLLLPKLTGLGAAGAEADVLANVDLDSYRVVRTGKESIALTGGEALKPASATPGPAQAAPETERLSAIVRAFNERFGTEWTDDDRVMRFLFGDLPKAVAADEEYQNAKAHSDEQNTRITHDRKVGEKMQDMIDQDIDLYRQFTDNPDFRAWLLKTLFELDYRRPGT